MISQACVSLQPTEMRHFAEECQCGLLMLSGRGDGGSQQSHFILAGCEQ